MVESLLPKQRARVRFPFTASKTVQQNIFFCIHGARVGGASPSSATHRGLVKVVSRVIRNPLSCLTEKSPVASPAQVMRKMTKWGCSSVGRAPVLQTGGRGFDSRLLHQKLSYCLTTVKSGSGVPKRQIGDLLTLQDEGSDFCW